MEKKQKKNKTNQKQNNNKETFISRTANLIPSSSHVNQ